MTKIHSRLTYFHNVFVQAVFPFTSYLFATASKTIFNVSNVFGSPGETSVIVIAFCCRPLSGGRLLLYCYVLYMAYSRDCRSACRFHPHLLVLTTGFSDKIVRLHSPPMIPRRCPSSSSSSSCASSSFDDASIE